MDESPRAVGVPGRRRRGLAALLVVGILILCGMMLYQMSSRVLGETALTRVLTVDAEHLYRAEAVVARMMNRLKRRPWSVRFYAMGGFGTGPWVDHQRGNYRGGDYEIWVQDVPYKGTGAVPGLVDLFVLMDYEGISRRYQYRMSILRPSLRRTEGYRPEYFDRPGVDITTEGGRTAAGEDATAVMEVAEENRAESEEVLDRVDGDPQRAATGGRPGCGDPTPGLAAADLAADLAAGLDTAAIDARQQAAASLERAIHLMGEAGADYQDFVPPLHRERFTSRAPAFAAARSHLQEAMGQVAGELRGQLRILLVLGGSYYAEAWQIGPASDQGVELLQRAQDTLQDALVRYQGAGTAAQARIPNSLIASVLIDLARVGTVAGRAEVAETAQVRAAEVVGDCGGVYGGREVDDVLADSLAPMDEDQAQARATSPDPLPPSGFDPVTDDEVGDFLNAAATDSWTPWPADSGKSPDFWDEVWTDGISREGEGGSGEPNGDIDRNGDGDLEPDGDIGLPDADGDGVADVLVLDQSTRECIMDSCIGVGLGLVGFLRCARDCREQVQQAAATTAAVAAAGGAGGTPVLETGGQYGGGTTTLDIPGDGFVNVAVNLWTGAGASNLIVELRHPDGSQTEVMSWVRGGGLATTPLQVYGQPFPGSVSGNDPVETVHRITVQAGDQLVIRISGDPYSPTTAFGELR